MADTTLPAILGVGDHASRPAAGDVGIGGLYSCTDHSLVYQTDGSSWTTWASLTGTGSVATDALWDAAGDLAVGTGSNTAARLAIGASGTVLRSNGTTAAWAAPAASPYVGSPQALHSLGTSVASALAADRVYITKFIPSANVTVDTAAWNCATSAGNLDLGIYNEALDTKLGSTGAFASPALASGRRRSRAPWP